VIATDMACRRHRPVLVDLVDHGERGPATPAALDHLATCRPCERELTELALTIAALRRAGAAYRRLPVAEVALQAVPDVVASVTRRHAGHRSFHLGGLVASAGIAALLVAPHVGLVPGRATPETAPVRPAAVSTWQRVEHRLASSPDIPPVAVVILPPRYPEGRTRPWKEVPSGDATARELEPS
jgi:anti-sigma factor RsiW